jgi:uncharacterized protein (TIGR02117 family)
MSLLTGNIFLLKWYKTFQKNRGAVRKECVADSQGPDISGKGVACALTCNLFEKYEYNTIVERNVSHSIIVECNVLSKTVFIDYIRYINKTMIIKKVLKITAFSIVAFILLIGLYFLSAYVLSRIGVAKEKNGGKDVTVYILNNGVHTDIVVPVKSLQMDWSHEIKFKNTTGKDTAMDFVALGWGDRGFYLETPTWGDLTFKTAFKAAFGLSHSAIHATFYKSMKEDKDCKRIDLSKEQYDRLIAYIQNSFTLDSVKHVIPVKTTANYNDDDAFYEAQGSYNLFHTCNTWANNGLKSCGQKACLWTPFEKGIFYQYLKNN